MTCGGARSGKYATGNNGMEMAPPKMMKREQTVANTGRWMKKSTNKAGFRPRWSWSVAAHLVGRDYLPVELLSSFCICSLTGIPTTRRSEEHTSELQSRLHLVCRLLLEKKKTNTFAGPTRERYYFLGLILPLPAAASPELLPLSTDSDARELFSACRRPSSTPLSECVRCRTHLCASAHILLSPTFTRLLVRIVVHVASPVDVSPRCVNTTCIEFFYFLASSTTFFFFFFF